MKIRWIAGALLTCCTASAVWAEDGSPSAAKLNKLGLSSMQSVSDETGLQVRGRGEFMKLVFNWQTAAGEKARVVNNQVVFVNPPVVAINDSNRASGIITDGGGINGGQASPVIFALQASANHQQTILTNNFSFSEISSSGLSASIVAGNATRLGISAVRP